MPNIIRIGNSHGVVLDKETLSAANLRPGDEVVIGTVRDGIVVQAKLSARGSLIAAMNQSMDENSAVYRILAK